MESIFSQTGMADATCALISLVASLTGKISDGEGTPLTEEERDQLTDYERGEYDLGRFYARMMR